MNRRGAVSLHGGEDRGPGCNIACEFVPPNPKLLIDTVGVISVATGNGITSVGMCNLSRGRPGN